MLIGSIILLERLKALHPSLAATGRAFIHPRMLSLSQSIKLGLITITSFPFYPFSSSETDDTPLRVIFAIVLLAVKFMSDVSHTNKSFASRTPWSLKEVNAIEKEMLRHLQYDVYIAADQ